MLVADLGIQSQFLRAFGNRNRMGEGSGVQTECPVCQDMQLKYNSGL